MTKSLIILVFSVIATSNVCESKDPFSLDEFLNGTFANKGWNGSWIGGDRFVYKHNNDYYVYDVTKGVNTNLLKGKILEPFKNPKIYLSGDEKYVLIKYNVKSIFRHSTTAQYAVYSTLKGKITYVKNKQHLQYCAWAGNTSSLLYVFENNIRYLKTIESKVDLPVTSDGVVGVVYNGVADWVYEEEVLSSGKALWVSPNGTTLVYAQFNDAEVPSFSYINYGEPGKNMRKYPEVVQIKYPKVGEKNPKFSLYLYDLTKTTKRPVKVELLQPGQQSENFVLYGVVWNASNFFVLTTDRVQTSAILKKCTGIKCTDVETYSETNGWLDVKLPSFNNNGTVMAQIKNNNKYQQLWLHETKSSKFVTNDKRTIVKIYGVNGNVTYFAASVENAHWKQHVYAYDLRSKQEQCLTCNFATPEGLCTYASVSFSKDMSHYAKICHGPGPNYVILEKTTDGSKLIVWEENKPTRQRLSTKSVPSIQDVVINVTDYSISARLLLPPNFDNKKKYPMIVNVYAGPNSNQIKDAFSVGLDKYLTTNKNYIYAYIDGRGSGRRGNDLMYRIYKKLGTVEIEDQILATQKLQSMYSYIDKSRTGIWGWSYGGFATAWALVKDNKKVFKCGISVAPVTNFVLYDSIYTERYMNLYSPNLKGYNQTDVTQQAEAFRGKQFLLIHGNADDNVHYQHSMLLARALELADVPFLQMSYPEENHSLKGVSSHLYHAIIKFWDDNFKTTTTYSGTVRNNISLVLIAITLLLTFFS